MEVIDKYKVKCHHCGDYCRDDIVHFEDKSFCCYGCKAVFELLDSSDLGAYYEHQDVKPAKVGDRALARRKYGFLDLPEVEEKLIRYRDEQKTLVRFYLSGIHCSSCIYLLEHLPKLEPAVLKAEVNFIRKELTLTFDHHKVQLKELAVVLSDLGYPPTINLDSLDKRPSKSKSAIGIKIAIAGFCFGNSMLISLPEYLDVGFQLENNFKNLFGWLNLLLSLPVVFYAAQDYFINSWKSIRHNYLSIDVPIALGIITLFSRSLFEIFSGIGPGYIDSLTGLIFFLLLGKWYQGKTYEALAFDRDYTSYFPISVSRLIGKNEETVLIKELQPGDLIRIHSHELIPGDGEIVEGAGEIDYSFVTGESDPVQKQSGEQVFAGGRQVGGQLVIRLSKTVSNSELTQMWNNQENGDVEATYDTLIDRVSKYFTIIIILLSIGTGAYWAVTDPVKIWDSVTAVLIIACPCALALTLPFAFGHSMRVFGRRGVYLKNANVIEKLAKIRSIVFDKTGTLTQNDPHRVRFHGVALQPPEIAVIRTVTSNSAHPLNKVITSFLPIGEKHAISAFDEQIGKGVIAKVGSDVIKMGSANWLGISVKSELHESQVHVILNDEYRGYFSIQSAYRKGIFDQLSKLKEKYDLHLLSGDNASERPQLQPYFSKLHFNQKPQQKLSYISNLKEPSLMVGDGLNDAGALRDADVGFAVCEDIHQFSPACDALIEAKALKGFDDMLKFPKVVLKIIIAAFILSFSYNVIGLSFAVTGNLSPIVSAILMPVSSVTVVVFITLAINIAAKMFKRQ